MLLLHSSPFTNFTHTVVCPLSPATALEKFETLFGLKLAHLLFSASEETSKVLQAKNTPVQEAVSAVAVTRAFYLRQRQDEAFDRFFDSTVKLAHTLNI